MTRMIKDVEEYHQFLAVISYLMEDDPEPESTAGICLDLLVNLVEEYEKTKYPEFNRNDDVVPARSEDDS